jgi:multidrug efflux pump subunit AcrA (membrane-fusion protein)
MFATVKLETDILKNRLLVPKEALLMRDQRALVFVAQEGLAKWHYVDVGEGNEEFIEIGSGIVAGDTVIVDGHYTLAHDVRVRIEGNK